MHKVACILSALGQIFYFCLGLNDLGFVCGGVMQTLRAVTTETQPDTIGVMSVVTNLLLFEHQKAVG